MQTGSPSVIHIVAIFDCDCEMELHQKFRKHHLHGEWFDNCEDICNWLTQEVGVDLAKSHGFSGSGKTIEKLASPMVAALPPPDLLCNSDHGIIELLAMMLGAVVCSVPEDPDPSELIVTMIREKLGIAKEGCQCEETWRSWYSEIYPDETDFATDWDDVHSQLWCDECVDWTDVQNAFDEAFVDDLFALGFDTSYGATHGTLYFIFREPPSVASFHSIENMAIEVAGFLDPVAINGALVFIRRSGELMITEECCLYMRYCTRDNLISYLQIAAPNMYGPISQERTPVGKPPVAPIPK